jgi:hypothetical protein
MMNYTEVVTESSLRASISVGLRQLAKSAKKDEKIIPVEQVSQWLKSHATTYDGRMIDLSWFRHLLSEELDTLRYLIGEQAYWADNYPEAGRLFNELATRKGN